MEGTDDLADRVRARLVKLQAFLAGYEVFVRRASETPSIDGFWEEIESARGALAFARTELAELAAEANAIEADPALAERMLRGTGITSLPEWLEGGRALFERCDRRLAELVVGRPPPNAPRGSA